MKEDYTADELLDSKAPLNPGQEQALEAATEGVLGKIRENADSGIMITSLGQEDNYSAVVVETESGEHVQVDIERGLTKGSAQGTIYAEDRGIALEIAERLETDHRSAMITDLGADESYEFTIREVRGFE